jgi:hypothetical protein
MIKVMEWISVKDRLPLLISKLEKNEEEEDEMYSEDILIYDPEHGMFRGVYRKSNNRYYWEEYSTGCGCCAQDLNVTHWRSLPKPPEEKERK